MRFGRRFLQLLAVAAAVSIAATSCGGDDRDVGAWTADVCGSIGSWIRSIEAGAETLGRELEDVSPGDVRSVKEGATRFLDQTVEDTESLLEEVEDSGVPAVEGGDRVVETIEDGFGRILDSFEEAQERMEDVPPDDAEALARAAEGVEGSLGQSGERIERFFEEASSEGLGGEELEQEFARNEACSDLAQLGV